MNITLDCLNYLIQGNTFKKHNNSGSGHVIFISGEYFQEANRIQVRKNHFLKQRKILLVKINPESLTNQREIYLSRSKHNTLPSSETQSL